MCVFMDDVVVWGSSIQEHDERLEKALQKLMQIGLCLNVEKCVFRQNLLLFLGEVMTEPGVQPDPSKIQAIYQLHKTEMICKEL